MCVRVCLSVRVCDREGERVSVSPLLLVGKHGLCDGQLVGSVGPGHVLGYPGHHIQALLGCEE